MKKLITMMVLAISMAGWAQDTNEIKTLVKKDAKIGGFMGVTVKLADLYESNTVLVGGTMGALFNDNLMIGAGGYGISSTNQFDGIVTPGQTQTQPLYLYGGYGGLIIGYKLFPNEIVHVSFPVLIGGGGFEVSDIKNSDADNIVLDHRIDKASFLVIEPTLEAEINITKFFRIAVGGSYRIIQGTSFDVNPITDEDLSSWSTHISLKFGKFW